MKQYIALALVVFVTLHSTPVIAADTPEPHRWYDKYSEIQVYNSQGVLVDDLNKYTVDGNWYDVNSNPADPADYVGLGYGIAGTI
ncbi:hypothetical protein EFL81_10230 [Weissella confusa]|uniref:hypothetical protein n=1 Tax=Weissella confusa TaxID=1583 RepID=UPI00223B94E7|nr:hypothetical protein [Weissella confusa]MCS9991187.1 hypothetical protein [Weissella confusa]MCS9997182.1 hypothetical protein [Weissella confusa]